MENNSEKVKFMNRLGVEVSIASILIIGALFFCLIYFTSNMTKKEVRQSTYQMQAMFTEKAAAEYNNWVNIYLNDVKVFSQSPVTQTGDVDTIVKWFRNNLNNYS